MIKNWKLFLESYKDDDEFDEIRKSFLEVIKPLSDTEAEYRSSLTEEDLGIYVDFILNNIKNRVYELVMDLDHDKELIDNIKKSLLNSIDKARKVMLESSFKDGLVLFLDDFILSIKNIAEDRDDEWKRPKKVEYSDMSKKEIESLIDDALDRRDFEEVKMLSTYLESFNYKEIDNVIDELVNFLFDLTIRIIE